VGLTSFALFERLQQIVKRQEMFLGRHGRIGAAVI
jgi:hypothetical protein